MNAQSRSVPVATFLRHHGGGQPLTRAFSQPLGAVLASLAARCSLSPNAVTLLALATSLAGAAMYASRDGATATWTAAVLLQLGYALDCADGQLARVTGRTSRLGGWLDVYCDHVAIAGLSFALLFHLVARADGIGLPVSAAFLLVLLYTAGRTGSLYSSNLASVWRRNAPAGVPDGRSFPRRAFGVLVDTPTALLAVCVLREWPDALLAYLLAGGLLYVVHGLHVGIAAARESG